MCAGVEYGLAGILLSGCPYASGKKATNNVANYLYAYVAPRSLE
jgi:hypothetical protein